MKKCIEPPFCVLMFGVSLALALVTAPFLVLAVWRGEWLRVGLLAVFLVSQGTLVGAQIFFIVNFFWRQINDQLACTARISFIVGTDDGAALGLSGGDEGPRPH